MARSIPVPGQALAGRGSLGSPCSLADVPRLRLLLASLVTHRHPPPTHSAHNHPLKKRRPFPGRTPPILGRVPGILPQPLQILLVRLPGEVARVGVHDERMPRLPGPTPHPHPAVRAIPPPAPAPIGVGPRVAWVVKHSGHPAVRQRTPHQIPLARPTVQTGGEHQPLLPKRSHGPER